MNYITKELIWYAGADVIKRFSSQLMTGQNKLECLFLADFSWLTKCLWKRPGESLSREHQRGVPLG